MPDQSTSHSGRSAPTDSLNFFQAVAAAAPTMLWVCDQNRQCIFSNTRWTEFTGQPQGNAFGDGWLTQLHADDRLAVMLNFDQGYATKSAFTFQFKLNTVAKGYQVFTGAANPFFNADNNFAGFVCTASEIQTDSHVDAQLNNPRDEDRVNKKLLEQQNQELLKQRTFIEALLDAIVDVIAVIDTDYRYISVNRAALNKYGLKKEDLIGKQILEIFPSVAQTSMYRDLQRAMNGEFVYDLTYTSTVISRHFENYYIPLFDINERVYAVMIVGHDITEVLQASEDSRKAKDTLMAKNQELQRSNEELEQFAYVASHDLQEPIRKIATYSNKLLTRSQEHFSEETRTYLERINKSTARMYELINGLLHYSRIARGNNHFVHVDLREVITSVLGDFDLKIQQKRAVVQYDQLPKVEAVAIQMRQLFSNLISNSLKFSKKEIPPVIQIASSALTDEQKDFYKLKRTVDYVNVFYLDNGIGFEQAYAEKVFELFQRLHGRNEYEGSGIGLSICRKIVSNHGGLIFAFSQPGKGVTFQVILPVSQQQFQ